MSREHMPLRIPGGPRLQSGIPKHSPPIRPLRARGLLVRGVVVATYVVDDTSHHQADGRSSFGPRTYYCDVLVYSNISGMRWRMLPRCLVMQDRGGLHDGEVWKPRAATKDITGTEMDPNKGSNPANWDGDHVIVGFYDDALNCGVILGGVPHPSVDVGAEESTQRRRLQLRQVDGDPRYSKHHGSYYGIDDDGSYRVDTRFAHDGKYEENGREPDPPTDGKGAQRHDLPLDAAHEMTLWDMTDPESPVAKVTLTVDKNKLHLTFVDSGFELLVDDSGTVIHLGGDGEWAVIDSKVQDEFARVKNDFYALRDEVGRLLIPLPEFPMPLMFGDILETFKAPLVYTAPGQAPINIRTGSEANANNAPMSVTENVGEFIPDFTRPGESGVFGPPSSPGATASDTVKIKS